MMVEQPLSSTEMFLQCRAFKQMRVSKGYFSILKVPISWVGLWNFHFHPMEERKTLFGFWLD